MKASRKPDAPSDSVERRFRDLGVPLTVQRRVVLQCLIARSDHPTPDDVYADVVGRLPGISRGTVYRTLDTLAELGLIVRVSHPGSIYRYDAYAARHHHLVCEKCGAMRDLTDPGLDAIKVPKLAQQGFRVKDFSVHFRGLCARCIDAPARSKRRQPQKRRVR